MSFRFHNFTISADYTYIDIIVCRFLQACRIKKKKKLWREALCGQLRLALKQVTKRKKISYSDLRVVFCLTSSNSDINFEGRFLLVTKGEVVDAGIGPSQEPTPTEENQRII